MRGSHQLELTICPSGHSRYVYIVGVVAGVVKIGLYNTFMRKLISSPLKNLVLLTTKYRGKSSMLSYLALASYICYIHYLVWLSGAIARLFFIT
jgi:hypothetical protein